MLITEKKLRTAIRKVLKESREYKILREMLDFSQKYFSVEKRPGKSYRGTGTSIYIFTFKFNFNKTYNSPEYVEFIENLIDEKIREGNYLNKRFYSTSKIENYGEDGLFWKITPDIDNIRYMNFSYYDYHKEIPKDFMKLARVVINETLENFGMDLEDLEAVI